MRARARHGPLEQPQAELAERELDTTIRQIEAPKPQPPTRRCRARVALRRGPSYSATCALEMADDPTPLRKLESVRRLCVAAGCDETFEPPRGKGDHRFVHDGAFCSEECASAGPAPRPADGPASFSSVSLRFRRLSRRLSNQGVRSALVAVEDGPGPDRWSVVEVDPLLQGGDYMAGFFESGLQALMNPRVVSEYAVQSGAGAGAGGQGTGPGAAAAARARATLWDKVTTLRMGRKLRDRLEEKAKAMADTPDVLDRGVSGDHIPPPSTRTLI